MKEKTISWIKAIFFFLGSPREEDREHGLTPNGKRIKWELGAWTFEIDVNTKGQIESFMLDRLEALNNQSIGPRE